MASDISSSLQKWSDTNQEILKISKNNRIEAILQKNISIHEQLKLSGNADEFFNETCSNMDNLLTVPFTDFVSVRSVVHCLANIMSISLDFSFVSYFKLTKIAVQLLKLNRNLIDTSYKNDILEPIISRICKDFLLNFESIHRNFTQHRHKIAKFQLNLIEGVWRLYPGSFNGASHLVKAIVDLECYSSKEDLDMPLCDLKLQMKDLLRINRHAPEIYIGFFTQFDNASEKKLSHLYKLCLEILVESMNDEVLLNTVLLSSENYSNLCLQLIQKVADDPILMLSNPELCNKMIINISQLLYIEGLEERNLRHFERSLVELMMQGKYCTGLFCMHIWLDFLVQIRSKEALMQYFLFFQAIMKQVWNPVTEIVTKLQIFISNILQFIIESHPKIAPFPFIQYVEPNSSMTPFNEVFQSFVESPSAEHYYELIKSLKFLSNGGIDCSSNDMRFGDLLSINANFEWNVYAEMIINIMNVIIATTDHQRKMFFLLKFKLFLDCEQSKPFSVQLKLVDMLFSYLPLVGSKIGLPELITRELNKLLTSTYTDSIVINDVVKRLASEPDAAKLVKNINFNGNDLKETQLDIFIRSKTFDEHHKCVQKDAAKISSHPSTTTTNYSRQLNIILEYSQWIQKQQLQKSDLNTIHLIANNFNKTANSVSFTGNVNTCNE